MTPDDIVTIKVKPGVKVNVEESERLEGDREFVASVPRGLKVSIQPASSGVGTAAASKITMCG